MAIKNIIKTMFSSKVTPPQEADPDSGYSTFSYSQEGEDLVLKRFFENKQNGFYVDIGAHHPFRFSNTFLFYKLGWHGINVDAMPGSMEAFNRWRPNDINLEIPISDKKQRLEYYIFNEPALNTFSLEEVSKKDGLRNYKVIEKLHLDTLPLSDLLDLYLPHNTIIDFLTIDVEGLDLEVLQSNDWSKYKPEMILVESLRNSLDNIKDNNIYNYLRSLSYELVAKTFNTMFFKRRIY